MKNVVIMGYLYRVSDANFKRFLRAKTSSNQAERGAATDYLGHDSGRVYQATDMDSEEAQSILDDLK